MTTTDLTIVEASDNSLYAVRETNNPDLAHAIPMKRVKGGYAVKGIGHMRQTRHSAHDQLSARFDRERRSSKCCKGIAAMIMAPERNPVLDHLWGVSPAEDRIWAQICGRAPSTKPWERRFMMLQAYIDESASNDAVFVIAGYVATAEAWAKFSKEWEELLPFATADDEGHQRFKMSEMAAQGRLADVVAFYRVIEEHVSLALSCTFKISELRAAVDRVVIPNHWGNQQFFSYRALLDSFHKARVNDRETMSRVIPGDKPVDFFFDDHSSKNILLSAWDEYIGNRPEGVELYEQVPIFGSALKFMPLQAADFWAWWVREACEAGTVDTLMWGDFGAWKENKHMHKIHISYSEDAIVETLLTLAREREGREPRYPAAQEPRVE